MKNLRIIPGAVLIFCLNFISCQSEKMETENLPNIIYIIADDLGYGDLSCYGQTKFDTPNIDLMASRGMLFTQHLEYAPVIHRFRTYAIEVTSPVREYMDAMVALPAFRQWTEEGLAETLVIEKFEID